MIYACLWRPEANDKMYANNFKIDAEVRALSMKFLNSFSLSGKMRDWTAADNNLTVIKRST